MKSHYLFLFCLTIYGGVTMANQSFEPSQHVIVHSDDAVSDAVIYNQIRVKKLLIERRSGSPPADEQPDLGAKAFCEELKRQTGSGNVDAMSLADLLKKLDDEAYQDMEDVYAREYAVLTASEQQGVDQEVARLRKVGVAYQRFDWHSIARADPEHFVANVELSCSIGQQMEGAGSFNSRNVSPTRKK